MSAVLLRPLRRARCNLLASLLLLSLLSLPMALASGSANADTSLWAGITSNSVWRGISQSSNEAAPFVDLIAETDRGYYAGVYASKQDTGLGNSASIDYYAGRLFGTGKLSLDLGYAYYRFPGQTHDDYDMGEAYAIAAFGNLTTGMYRSVNSETADDAPYGRGDTYTWISYEFRLPAAMRLRVTGGYYGFDENEHLWGNNDFAHMQMDLSAGPLTFSASHAGSNAGDGDTLLFLTWMHRLF